MFERSVELVTLWLGLYTSDTELAELLYISMKTGPGSIYGELVPVFCFDHNVQQGYDHYYTREHMCGDY